MNGDAIPFQPRLRPSKITHREYKPFDQQQDLLVLWEMVSVSGTLSVGVFVGSGMAAVGSSTVTVGVNNVSAGVGLSLAVSLLSGWMWNALL
jgi:hypothetical protein